MINVKSILVTVLIMVGVTFSNVTLTLTNLDTDAGTVDVYMVNDTAVGGFQFGLDGVNMTGGSGGSSADAGFTVSASSSTLLAFSFTGATIPAGEGVLVSVSFENPDASVEMCIENSVFSDDSGNGLEFIEDCTALAEGGGCTDSDACNYDPDAQFDDGSCDYPDECSDCDGGCTCFEDCSGVCDGADYSCFTVVDEFVGSWALEVMFYESDCSTASNTYLCDDGGDDLYPTMEECEAGCSDSDACYSLEGEVPSWVTFDADGTAFIGINTDIVCEDDFDCSGQFSYGEGFCNLGNCVVTQENFWGVDPSGCFNVWDDIGGPSEDCNTWEVNSDGFIVITGIDSDLGLCQEIQALPAEVGCNDPDALNFDQNAWIPCLDCCDYPVPEEDVNLQITDVTSDNVEVSVKLNSELGGFQFTLASTCEGTTWSAGSGGLADDAGFNVSVGGTGVALGFSLTGATIAEGSDGVLVNVGTSFSCEEATFSVVAGTFSSPVGTALGYNLGDSFDYPAVSECPEGQSEACDGDCYAEGDGPVLDDCGACLYSYCYDMVTHIPDYATTEEACTAAGNMWVNPGDPGDPTFNAEMDCAGVCGGDAVVDCADECGGAAVEDACGECGGDATDASSCLEHFVVDLDGTGVNQLVIFSDSITSLEAGDEVGVFDTQAITNSGDCSSTIAESLVGSGVWTGDQMEIVAIGSVDNCAFGGFQLPGWVSGNSVVIKVYRPSTGVEYAATATYSAGTGTFGDLFMAVSELELEEPNPPYYNVNLNPTGVNQLIIFQNTISSLEAGDEIGVHDLQAITNSGDCSSALGVSLVGAGVWTGDQLEIVSIGSVDNCAFGGSQLPGWVSGNGVVYNVYRPSTGELFNVTATYSAGTGTFGDLFMAVSDFTLDPFLNNDDVWLGPDSYTLSQNYPNPFNPSTDISFEAGVSGEVSLVVYDILGNKVKTLVSGFVTPGNYVVSWDGTDNNGSNVSSGVYVYTLITSGQTISKRMLLVK